MPPLPPRPISSRTRAGTMQRSYLAEFSPNSLVHRFADILILGGGLAGLRAALETDPAQNVLVVTKDRLQNSNSAWAQGGIASVIDPEDRIEFHVRDTLVAGAGLCDRAAVEMVVAEGPGCIEELVAIGTRFDREDELMTLGREGGHSHNRIVHALGDATGLEVMRAVIERVRLRKNLEIAEQTFTVDLLTDGSGCRGALVQRNGQLQMVWANQTILATGGAGQLYRETTNPPVATADGHAMAIRAGVRVRDMEFMQFHPTVLYIAGSSRTLITEAIRGEGAWLVDRDGHRFMPDYDPRAELAPRDVVAQAIVRQMEITQFPHVWLELGHLDPQHIRQRFPGIFQACAEFGLDLTRDRIPVRPGAHYMVGGVVVDHEARTSLPGLWAAGEVTSSGLHGANRLASNSLLEGIVYGRIAGRMAGAAAMADPRPMLVPPLQHDLPRRSSRSLDLSDIRNSLKSLMWRSGGVERSAGSLAESVETMRQWQSVLALAAPPSVEGWELQNLVQVGLVMLQAALRREESRGVHFRTDFPAPDDARWRGHLGYCAGQWEFDPLTPPCPAVSAG